MSWSIITTWYTEYMEMIGQQSAQNIQDEIFRKMSADEKIKLGSWFWRLAKDLVGDKIRYDRGRPAAAFGKSRKNS